jgi:UDP-glucuronate 4-epimerase
VSRFVVTGCAGFIGSHLTEALLACGHDVVGIDSFTDFYPRCLKEQNLEAAQANLRFSLIEDDLSEAALELVISGSDGVFHLAAKAGVRDSWGDSFAIYVRDNLLATQRVFEAAAGAGVRVVFSSSSSVYGDAEAYPTREDARPRPVSPYGVTKLSCEQLADAYTAAAGLDVVCLRYFSVYGPRQRPDMAFRRIVDCLVDGRPFVLLGSGAQVRDFTYVGDIVNANLASMARAPAGAIYNVGGGTPTSLADAIALCERLTGQTLRRDRRPPSAGDAVRTLADTTRIRSDIGWRPRHRLADGLAAQVSWQLRHAPVEADGAPTPSRRGRSRSEHGRPAQARPATRRTRAYAAGARRS